MVSARSSPTRSTSSSGARSLRTFETFAETFGQEIDLHQVGYLFLLEQPEHVEAFEKNVALQNEIGVPSRLIDVAEAKALSPLISTEGLLAAAYSPTDGHCTPESVVSGYAGAARRAGARLVRNCAVTAIDSSGGAITRVVTDRGTIATDTVICTAGAWSRGLGAMVGVDLPVEPLRRQILTTAPVPGLDPRTPFTIDFSTSFYFHGEGQGLLLGMSDPHETPGFKLTESDEWLAGLGRGDRAARPRDQRGRALRRLGRALRDDPGPQRAGRGGRRSLPLPLRHGLLRSRLPDGPGHRRGDARPLPRPARPSSTSAP